MGSRHLYIHIPFCPSRCRYCDFASEAIHVGGEYRIERYFRMLHSEIQGFLPELHLPLGVQSFHPGLLRSLGRRVEINQLDTAIGAVKDVGWLDWNLDLVFGIPGQDRDSMHRDIYSAVQARPTHIFFYDLTYKGGYLDYLAKEIQVPFRDAKKFAEDHYAEAADLLPGAGC